MVSSSSAKWVLCSLVVCASACMAFVGHQPIIGGSFTRQYSRGLRNQHRSRNAAHCTKTQMGLRDEAKPTPGALFGSAHMEALTANDEIAETFDLNGMAKRLELSLLKNISEPARANFPHAQGSSQMWRVGPAAISCSGSSTKSQSAARPFAPIATSPVQDQRVIKDGALQSLDWHLFLMIAG